MKLVLLQVGKTDKDYLRQGIEDFTTRIKRMLRFEIITIPDLKNRKSLNPEEQKKQEAERLMSQLQAGDTVILLDERGKSRTSMEFSTFLDNLFNSSSKRIVFIIGGPYGFNKTIYSRSDMKVSLSPMTLSHQMVRLLFVEQLYRALSIQKGLPYHNE